MNMILHNLKVAVRNLMKYKMQTAISVLSIAVGIVMLAFVHSLTDGYRLPAIYHAPHYDRSYNVTFKSISKSEPARINSGIINDIKKKVGSTCAEKIVVAWEQDILEPTEFHLADSTVRKGYSRIGMIDSDYAEYAGLKSAATGITIVALHPGEAIVSEDFAKKHFLDRNPIGAVQTFTLSSDMQIPIKIVDVFKNVSLYDKPISNDSFYFYGDENTVKNNYDQEIIPLCMSIVLMKGFTEQQLMKELNECIAPYGLRAEISKVSEYLELSKIIAIRMLSYIMGSLILLAAIIGFLRIQMQTFRLRRRELALRIVNGASMMRLFGMLFTEIALLIGLSVIIAIFMSTMLQDFLDMKLSLFMEYSEFQVKDLWKYSIVIGGGLMVICSLIAWITLLLIYKSGQGLAENLRRNYRHLGRYVMLGLQTSIVIITVCGIFILLNGEDHIIRACNMPEKDSQYKEYLYYHPEDYYFKWEGLLDEIKRLPDLDKAIYYSISTLPVREYEEFQNPDNSKEERHFQTICTDDPSLPDVVGMDVEWFIHDIDRNRCLLISEKLYRQFDELGILDSNTMRLGYNNVMTLPIGGIVRSIPYNMNGEALIAIAPEWTEYHDEYLLIPKFGKGKSLARSVDEVIVRIAPECLNKMIYNYRETTNIFPDLVDTIRIGGLILGCVSLVICAMGVFTCITLETRARRKEIAIRKVNGAKSMDIYKMFERVYALLLTLALAMAIPVSILVNRWVEKYVNDTIPESIHLSPVGPIILGSSIVILLVISIVWWQIHRVMQVDPAKIIAKE
ncbi:MAG: ABC transporter permease [Muribaculaceae bacterium]|nr:ABC transporter permease [Muribaculaceae bacterium]